ncbi:hypothetical protein [Campylobacter coli]|uniref:hypothetical protein n=1 Tax=Campylobacter coli TaxID=195 RepID=UPI000A88EAA6|nr:hypothetical protein [Campylobacter coli]
MHVENNLSPEDRQGIENAVLAKEGIIPDWIVNFDRQDVEDVKKEVEEDLNTITKLNNTIDSYSKQYTVIEPVARKIRIVTKPTESTLKIMDYSLKYVLNGERSVAIKAIAEGVEVATYTLTTITAAAAGVATLVGMLCPPLAPLAAFGAFMIFNKGEELSYYISQKTKDITIDFFNEKIEYFPRTIDLGNGKFYNTGRLDSDIKNMFFNLSLSLFTPHPYPSYSKEYKFALAKKKELITKTSIASNSYNFMDEEYRKNIQDLQEQDQIINQEEQKYQIALKFYKEDNKIKNEIFNPLFKTLNENLSFQLKQERNTFINPNQSLSIIATKKYSLKTLNLQDIDNININSEFAYLRALFLCESFLVLNNNDEVLLNEKITKEILECNEDEYILFILHKDKLNNTYLQARKELYKSIDEFKRLGFKDLENAYQTYINSLIINKEINSKDETINKNENKEINKNLNQDENLNQENNIKENTSSIIKNTNSKNNPSLNLKQKDISINQKINNTKEQDFNL